MSKLSPLQRLDAAHQLHPFTNHVEMHEHGTQIITGGSGVWLEDQDGRRLLDALAGLWCVNVGYGRRELAEAASRQMERLCYYPSFFNTTTEPAIELSAKLSQLAPQNLNHTMFSNSGSEANETALKMIRAFWNLKGEPHRTKIISREFAYHGVTLAAASLTGLSTCQTPFDLPLPGFLHAPSPHAYAAGKEADPAAYADWCIARTSELIEREEPGTVAAIFAEPVQGAGGVIVPPPGYLAKLRALARQHGILFVADEVITAFGRLGDWFASGLWDLDPDFICLAKGLTSGYLPLGATMVSDEIADVLIRGGPFAHGFTYSGHPTSCAVALANLAVIENERLISRVRDDIGPYFQKTLARFSKHRAVGEVRGCQLIGALELVPPGGKAMLTLASQLGLKAASFIREEGVIVRGIRDLIAIAPPLTATREEVDTIFTAIERGLNRLPH